MSATSPTPSFDPGPVRPWWKDSSGLTEYLHEVGLFLRGFRSRLKTGEHSRSPLRLIRFQIDQGTYGATVWPETLILGTPRCRASWASGMPPCRP